MNSARIYLLAGLSVVTGIGLLFCLMAWTNDDNIEIRLTDDTTPSDERSCDIDIAARLEVGKEQVRIHDRRVGLVGIDRDGGLTIDGATVKTDAKARAMLATLHSRLTGMAPQMVDIAEHSIALARDTIIDVFDALMDRAPPDAVQQALDKLETSLQHNLRRDDDTIHVGEDGLNAIEQAMEDIEPELEAAMSQSIGTLLYAVGDALTDKDSTFEENMEAFGERMERFGEAMSQGLEEQAERLGQQAHGLCDDMDEVRRLQRRLSRSVKELKGLRIVR